MADIRLTNIKHTGEIPGTEYDNPTFQNSDNEAPPSYSEKASRSISIPDDGEKNRSFSPNNDDLDYDKEFEEPDSDDEFEDLEAPSNPILNKIKSIQDGMTSCCDTNGKILGLVFFTILPLLLYLTYFIYFLVYHTVHSFDEEDDIRLVWVTCIVLCMIIWAVKKYLGDKITACMEPCWNKLEPHGMTINWAILCILYLFIIIFIFVDIFYLTNNPYNLVSVSGIVLYVILFFIFSTSPAHVNWRAVLWGLALQFIFAIVILKTWWGFAAFSWMGSRVDEFLAHTRAGSTFLFRGLDQFAFSVLPTIVFFSAAISVLFYLGWMQVIIQKVAWIMQITMGTTAAESLNAAGNIFIGQSEAPLMIRPLIQNMTRSELHAVMTGGFATIAGSVLAAYIQMGAPANHLISASIMSAPAALAMAKLFYPETKKSKTKVEDVGKSIEKTSDRNIIDALSSGASASISLVANIAVNLLAFLAALNFINQTLTWFGDRVDDIDRFPPQHEPITLEWFCSYLLWPFALVMGTELVDCRQVAKLIGIKTILNEFVAYDMLGNIKSNTLIHGLSETMNHTITRAGDGYWIEDGMSILTSENIVLRPDQAIINGTNLYLKDGIMTQRSLVISTYALCGFANFGSMGIMLGALGAMAPRRKKDLSRVVIRAMIAGNVACFMTAAIAGLFYSQEY